MKFFFFQNLNIRTQSEITEPELKISELDPKSTKIPERVLYLYTKISENSKYPIRTRTSIPIEKCSLPSKQTIDTRKKK